MTALRLLSHHLRIRYLWTASVEPADSQVPLLRETSIAVVQVCCGTVISSCPSRHSLSFYSLSLSLASCQQGPHVLASASPVGHSGPEPNPNDDHLRFC